MKRGYTLIELLLVIGLLAILLSLGGVVFSNFVRQDQVQSEAEKIQNLIQEARVRTVSGYTLGGELSLNFGVYFDSDRYILFPGLIYSAEDDRNQVFLLPSGWRFSPIFFPGGSVVFEKVSGEVGNYDPAQNFVTLVDSRSGQAKKITVNRLGVVILSDP